MLAWYSYDASTVLLILMLLVACAYDFRQQRIPNWLVFAGIATAMLLQTAILGWRGLGQSLIGLAVGNCILLPFYLLKVHGHRLMGAGDVKLMAAVGAFLGPFNTLFAAGLTLAVGTVAGLAYLFWKGLLKEFLQRNWLTLKTLLLTHRWVYQPPSEAQVRELRFPYAMAIAAGTLLAMGQLSQLSFHNLRTLLSGVLA